MNAIKEAISRKKDNSGLNEKETLEFGYSLEFNTVGCRHEAEGLFKVFNTGYPKYKNDSDIIDWASVGVCNSKKS